MESLIEDLFRIYISCCDSYNPQIHQTINNKYKVIDKSVLAVYMFTQIVEERGERNQELTDTLVNYLLKHAVYSETGNLVFEIPDTDFNFYKEIVDELIIEKFNYKNRVMQNLKYNYKKISSNIYRDLIVFLEDVAEFVIFKKLVSTGNQNAKLHLNEVKTKIINKLNNINSDDHFYVEKKEIIDVIKNDEFDNTVYGKLCYVGLNLMDVYRYSNLISSYQENDLLHSYTVTVMSILLAEYSNEKLGENFDIYTITIKALYHDFAEYKGTEIITHFKNYNEVTKKMFAEIEAKDEIDLNNLLGNKIYNIISNFKNGAEGYVAELIDKMLGIMKLWVETRIFS